MTIMRKCTVIKRPESLLIITTFIFGDWLHTSPDICGTVLNLSSLDTNFIRLVDIPQVNRLCSIFGSSFNPSNLNVVIINLCKMLKVHM